VITRPLGRSGVEVSVLGVGTVSLGTPYGIPAAEGLGPPPRGEAVALLREAADAGITLFDTAPAYGEAESILGEALGDRSECLLATKVGVPAGNPDRHALAASVRQSLDASRRALRREVLDIVQIHNATEAVIRRGELAEILLAEREAGRIRLLGATVYTEAEALAAIRAGVFDVVQVPFNGLDRGMAGRVFPEAARAGVGVVARSVYLKGVLTPRARKLPEALRPLREAAARLVDTVAGSWDALPAVALRYCLGVEGVSCVLVGPRSPGELREALDAVARGPLPPGTRARVEAVGVDDPALLNPVNWPIP